MIPVLFTLSLASVTTTMTFDWGVIITAVAPTLAVLVTWYVQRKSVQHTSTKVSDVQQSVNAVHSIVNGKNDALMARVAELEAENRKLKNS